MSTLPLLVEADELRQYPDYSALRIIDLSNADVYAVGHLPNAVQLDYAHVVRAQAPVAGLLPSAEEFAQLMGQLGINNHTHVVAYDNEGSGRAARLLWTLKVFGHQHLSLLNGGLAAWQLSGGDISRAMPLIEPQKFVTTEPLQYTADHDYIRAHLGSPGFALLDARSPGEYLGSVVRANRGGHIPGAVNFEWTEALQLQPIVKLKPGAETLARLEALGLHPDQDIVTYCQTHHRSALTWFVLHWLGFKHAKGYPGSWSDWGNRADTPIA